MIVLTIDPIQPEQEPPKLCSICKTEASIDFCRHCGQEFCASHRSRYNSKLCTNCITDSNTSIEVGPYIDDEGKERRVRQFKLIGEGWPHSVQLLSSLTDIELEDHISEMARRLKQAQLDLDYTKILHSAASFEQEHRGWSRAHAARKRRENIEASHKAQGSVKLNAKAYRVRQPVDPAIALAKTLGVTVEKARELMKVLGKGV